jgi:hypothetical protein
MIIIDSIFSQEAELVKTLRFEKELENVLFIWGLGTEDEEVGEMGKMRE